MSNFCPDQGRTRVYGEAYFLYAKAENPRRTPSRAKRAIYGWALTNRHDGIAHLRTGIPGVPFIRFSHRCINRLHSWPTLDITQQASNGITDLLNIC